MNFEIRSHFLLAALLMSCTNTKLESPTLPAKLEVVCNDGLYVARIALESDREDVFVDYGDIGALGSLEDDRFRIQQHGSDQTVSYKGLMYHRKPILNKLKKGTSIKIEIILNDFYDLNGLNSYDIMYEGAGVVKSEHEEQFSDILYFRSNKVSGISCAD